MLAVFSLVYAATDTAYCEVLISLGLAESRILPAAPADTRPRTPLISFCSVQLRTFRVAHSLATLCLSTTSGPDPGEFSGFWGSMVFRHAPIPRKGSGNQQQQHIQDKQLHCSHPDKSRLSLNIATLVNNSLLYWILFIIPVMLFNYN